MSKVKASKVQPAFDGVLKAIELTPEEIFDTFGAKSTGNTTAYSSHIDIDGRQWEMKATNPRTQNSVQIGAIEDENFSTKFVVELRILSSDADTDDSFICCFFDDADNFETSKNNAHEAFINLSMLIGVKVGYQLILNPNTYAVNR